MGPVILACIVALSAVIGPLLLSRMNAAQDRKARKEDAEIRRKEREEDYAREDEVARRAQEAAERQTKLLRGIDAQSRQIHGLVNNDMTLARQAELDQTRRTEAALQRVMDKYTERSQEIPLSDKKELTATQTRVTELEAILADRLAAQHEVDKYAAEAKVIAEGEDNDTGPEDAFESADE